MEQSFNANQVMASFFAGLANQVRATKAQPTSQQTQGEAVSPPEFRKCRGARRRGRGRCTKQVWTYA